MVAFPDPGVDPRSPARLYRATLAAFAVAIVPFVLALAGQRRRDVLPGGAALGWEPFLTGLTVVSGVLIGVASVVISFVLVRIARGAPGTLPFLWAFVASSVFVVAGSLTYFAAALTVWEPAWILAGGLKYPTAMLSVAMAVTTPPLLPRVLKWVREAAAADERRRDLDASHARLVESEAALRASQTRFAAFMDNGPVVAWIKDADLRYVYANANLERLWNVPADALIGKDDTALVSPAIAASIHAHDLEVMRSGTPSVRVSEAPTADGEVHLWRSYKFPFAGPDGRRSMGGLAIDITEEHRLEEQVRASEERFRRSFEDAPIGKALVGLDGRFLSANRAFCELTGYSEGELRDVTFAEVTHPDDLDAVLVEIDRLLSGEVRTYQMEKRYRRKDGAHVWVLLATSLVRGSDGAPLYFVSQVQDISARKQAEADLAEERDLLQGLMDAVPDLIYFKDAAGRFTRANRGVAALFGLADPAELVGKTDFDLYAEDRAWEFAEDERRFVAKGEALVNKLQRHDEDGTERWVLATKVPLRGEDGVITGLVGISRDVTQLKRAEAELARERDLLHTLMDAVPDPIYFKDADARLTLVNRAAAAFYGYDDPAAVVGKTDLDIFPEPLARDL